MAKSKKHTSSTTSGAKGAPAQSHAPVAATPAPAKKTSEIDDIFSSKPKPKSTSAPQADVSASKAAPASGKKASKKKRKASEVEGETGAASNNSSKPTPAACGVKVVEFSEPGTGKASAPPPVAAGPESANKKRKVESMDEFLGNNGRKRFTDDGYPLYYMEDLLAQEGGDTDLCPFECDCCF